MTPQRDIEEQERRLTVLIEEMANQSDRGAAIIGAAWVEEALLAAIESYLHTDVTKAWDGLFRKSGPMTSFSAKIDLAQLLGFMTPGIHADLHRIRRIRNEFAHEIAHRKDQTPLTFSTGHIKDACLALRCIAHESIEEPRAAFSRACGILYSDFSALVDFGIKASDPGRVFEQICAQMPSNKSLQRSGDP